MRLPEPTKLRARMGISTTERIVAITGAAGALGGALAETLAGQGYKLALFDTEQHKDQLDALAKKLGVKHQVVYGWTRVPPKWVLRVEKETGISRHKLRPDVFGPAPDSKEAAA